ncbi:MAG: hypothetical protein GY847_34780 [Proteobacteria bacterium]|nr:hypothetical protein [Pseudomonadota bacterium]
MPGSLQSSLQEDAQEDSQEVTTAAVPYEASVGDLCLFEGPRGALPAPAPHAGPSFPGRAALLLARPVRRPVQGGLGPLCTLIWVIKPLNTGNLVCATFLRILKLDDSN